MADFVRLLLLVGLAGAALTALVAGAMWHLGEERRIGRALARALGGPPDAQIIAHGRGRGAGFSLASGLIIVVWDSGGWRLAYALGELVGAELLVDGVVAARVHRGETRRALERVETQAGTVDLRLVFDDARHPDFDLALWPVMGPGRKGPATAAEATRLGNRWLAGMEAMMRRAGAGPGAAVVRPEPPAQALQEPAPWEDDDDFDEDFEDEDPEEDRMV